MSHARPATPDQHRVAAVARAAQDGDTSAKPPTPDQHRVIDYSAARLSAGGIFPAFPEKGVRGAAQASEPTRLSETS